MTLPEFREALWNGLGRPILYAHHHDVAPFQEAILDACLHCYAVDPQCEGTRAPFMYELVTLTPDRDFYSDEVLKALPGCGDDYDAVQRFRFASYMAMDGDDRAKRAMYDNFNPGPRMAEQTGTDFLRMDGLGGLLFAAEKVGALLISATDRVDLGMLTFVAGETLGEEQALNGLRKAGETDSRIEAYLVALEVRQKKQSDFPSIQNLTYAELKPRLAELRHRVSAWGERASAENLELAARDLLTAETTEEQLQYLRIFRWRAFPLDHTALFPLLASTNERLADVAAEALANITHPSVRELAFCLVEERRAGRDQAIMMLSRNWQDGDHEIALRWFEQEEDRETRHGLGMDLRKFWEEHPDATSEGRMLLALYEKGPCSMCREFVVRRLLELEQLPDEIRTECAHDASEEVRELVGGEPG